MKVYLVYFDDTELVALFSTREKAEQFKQKKGPHNYSIKEREIEID